MNEEEIQFNKLLELFKNNSSNKRTLTVLECAELINVGIKSIATTGVVNADQIEEIL